jgi:AraC-like DNA-binding protein
LPRFVLFETKDLDEFRDAILNGFAARSVEVHGRDAFEARGGLAAYAQISLVHGASNHDVTIEYPEVGYARLITSVAGKGRMSFGREEHGVNRTQSCFVSADRPVLVRGHGAHAWLTLRVNTSALKRQFTAMTGLLPPEKIIFSPAMANQQPEVAFLRELISLFAYAANHSETHSPIIVGRLEDLIVLSFLRLSSSASRLLDEPKSAAHFHVRLAADYLEANWARNVSIEELAQMTKVGARSLFRSFKKVHGCSPLTFAKRVRLEHARNMLTTALPMTTVTSVSLLCGFMNPGHFARDYQSWFGELPSETLARTRTK